jgi:sigma-B regulation protein RsbU (phosphoserine phosphatase)
LFICEGNRAAEFGTVTATHSVEFFGLPPTGHQLEYHVARLFSFRDGLIVSEQRIYDFGGVLERLEKARLERELTIASEVQHTLLGRTEHRGTYFETVGWSLPCRAIGGDFLEHIDLPSGNFGIAVGDVSGKGPAAALVGAMLQGMFSVVARESPGPSSALSWINRVLCRRGIEPRFATMAYGILSSEGRFTYSNAGHVPPLLLSAHGVRRLTAGGPMLGVFADAVFPEDTLVVSPGDTLVAFSDGVTDATGPDGEDFGVERFVASACAQRLLPPAQLLQHLFAAVQDFCGSATPGDDVTITVTRFRG